MEGIISRIMKSVHFHNLPPLSMTMATDLAGEQEESRLSRVEGSQVVGSLNTYPKTAVAEQYESNNTQPRSPDKPPYHTITRPRPVFSDAFHSLSTNISKGHKD